MPITTAGDRDRTRPFGEIGAPRRLRQGARGGAARGPDRRCRPLGQGHDLDRHGGARRRRLPGRARIRAMRCAAPRRFGRGCGSARPPSAGARSCSRSSRRSRSSRCAATSTRACASAASAVSTQSCSRRAGSTGLGSQTEIGLRFDPAEMLPEAGQGSLALQVRAGEEGARRGGRRRGDAAARRGRAPLRRAGRRRLPGAGRRAPRRLVADRARRRRGRRLDRAAHRRRPGRGRARAARLRVVRVDRHAARGAGGGARSRPGGARPRGRSLPADRAGAARRRAGRRHAATTG